MQYKTALSKTVRLLAALMVALATVLPTVVAAAPTTAPAAAPLTQPESGVISGTVFRDYNANGTQQTWANSTNTFNEPGIAGVTVTAYDSSGAVAGSATSGATGTYSLSATGTGPYRVEFTLPLNGSLDFLSPGAAGATTVQFVPDGNSSNVNVGFNNPIDYSQDAPPLITPITFVGSRSSAARDEFIVGIGYNQSGDLSAPAESHHLCPHQRHRHPLRHDLSAPVEADPGRRLHEELCRPGSCAGFGLASECRSCRRHLRQSHQCGAAQRGRLRQSEQDHRSQHGCGHPWQPGRRQPAPDQPLQLRG
ncbi:MAG: SdrD B-like domain-containing protein [Anaerolineae bacterium]